MILYESTHGKTHHRLGTSGFLYRSDKLMYDARTKSLWNTLQGRPVLGPLVGKGIVLKRRSVVTTTWGAWRKRHPATTVLSIKTGYDRDYGEGVAYRRYFADDRLMFNVAVTDHRLKNKAEVLGLVFNDKALAIDIAFLAKYPIYHDRMGAHRFVVLTDSSGASRVYAAPKSRIVSWDGDRLARDRSGTQWTLHEDRLESKNGERLLRLPQHRSFWFGWYAAFPKTRLIKANKVAPKSRPVPPSKS